MGSIKQYELIKLNKKNYDIWFYKIKAAFRAEKIEGLITGSTKESLSLDQTTWSSQNGLGISIITSALNEDDIIYCC